MPWQCCIPIARGLSCAHTIPASHPWSSAQVPEPDLQAPALLVLPLIWRSQSAYEHGQGIVHGTCFAHLPLVLNQEHMLNPDDMP